jgi:hypothetical protein
MAARAGSWPEDLSKDFPKDFPKDLPEHLPEDLPTGPLEASMACRRERGGKMAERALLVGERPEYTRNVTRGARRFLRAAGFSVLSEFPLPNGRRADLVALSGDGLLRIVEVKSSIADFRADAKWLHYRPHCDQFYFAVPPEMEAAGLPLDAGLLLADAHGGMLAREAPTHKLAPASRRAMLLRFASLAADRLHHELHRDEFG